MSKGSTNAEKAKWRAMRATPRKLTADELHQRAVARRDAKRQMEKFGLEVAKAKSAGDYSRKNKAWWKRQNAFHRGVRKNAELGINPIYIGGLGARAVYRGSHEHKRWVAASREWDRANPAA
jgi:hypothetical protein